MIFLQTHLNECGVHAGIGGEQRGEIGHDPDIRDHGVQFFRRNYLANDVFHGLDVALGHLDAGARGGFNVDDKLARVCSGEERKANQRIENEAEQENTRKPQENRFGTVENLLHPPVVAFQHAFECGIKSGMKFRSPGKFRSVTMSVTSDSTKNLRAIQWHYGNRHKIGGQQRDHDAQGQRGE